MLVLFLFTVLIVSAIVIVALFKTIDNLSSHTFSDAPVILIPVMVLSSIVFVITLVTSVVLVPSYISAEVKAEVINKEFGTNYTQRDVFYAEGVIEEIQEVKRQRIELNGNILKKDKE